MKKYTNIDIAVINIARDPNVAIFDKAVNLFNNVSGKSITILIPIFITNLYLSIGKSSAKYLIKSPIAFDPMDIYAVIIPKLLI